MITVFLVFCRFLYVHSDEFKKCCDSENICVEEENYIAAIVIDSVFFIIGGIFWLS